MFTIAPFTHADLTGKLPVKDPVNRIFKKNTGQFGLAINRYEM